MYPRWTTSGSHHMPSKNQARLVMQRMQNTRAFRNALARSVHVSFDVFLLASAARLHRTKCDMWTKVSILQCIGHY